MASFFRDNADLDYYLTVGVDWARLSDLSELGDGAEPGFQDAEEALAFYREIAALVGEFAAGEVAPHAAEIDREGVCFEDGEVRLPPRLDRIFKRLAELGLHGLNLPRELGGLGAPMLVYFINCELLARADVSVMVHHGFHSGTAMAMLVMSLFEGTTELDPETGKVRSTRFHDGMAEIAAGAAWGSMDITEPNAGSDMAALRTRATRDAAGNWTVSGEKIFITSGHGKYHFVIARSEPESGGTEGLAGLSLFLVEAYRDEADGRRTRFVTIERVEEKLGHHGSATVALHFEHAPAQLIGKRGEGFRLMLEFMNQARLSVGFESIGLCEAAYRSARSYAAERRSMGKPIERHELIADYLAEMETDIVGLRALGMEAAFQEEVGIKTRVFGQFVSAGKSPLELEREVRERRARARRLTPLFKYLAAEKAVEMARRSLQIHGGNGYMKEYGVEKLLRDALVMPIYEGTSQIQALMAMKDRLGAVLKSPKAFLKSLAEARWRALSARDALERRVARVTLQVLGAEQHLITRSLAGKLKNRDATQSAWSRELFTEWDPKRDFSLALLHAERLTRLLADQAILEVLLGQSKRHSERRIWLERYLERAEPRVRFLHDEITSIGGPLLAGLLAAASKQEAAE